MALRISNKTMILGGGAYILGVGAYTYYALKPPACGHDHSNPSPGPNPSSNPIPNANPSLDAKPNVPEAARLAAFASGAADYDRSIGTDEMFMGLGIMRSFLLGHAKGRVLEVAAGTGRNLSYYKAAKVTEVVVTDPCAEMLDQNRGKLKTSRVMVVSAEQAKSIGSGFVNAKAAKKLAGTQGMKEREVLRTDGKVRVELEVADAHQLPYADDSFDTVVDTFGLCSMEDPVRAVREMMRVCKPGGAILLLEHGRSPYDWLAKIQDKDAEKHAQRWGCYWNKDIGGILDAAGLDVQSRWDWHFGTTNYIRARPQQQRQ